MGSYKETDTWLTEPVTDGAGVVVQLALKVVPILYAVLTLVVENMSSAPVPPSVEQIGTFLCLLHNKRFHKGGDGHAAVVINS